MTREHIQRIFSEAGEDFEDMLILAENSWQLIGFIKMNNGRVLLLRENKSKPVMQFNDFLEEGDSFTLDIGGLLVNREINITWQNPFRKAWFYFRFGIKNLFKKYYPF